MNHESVKYSNGSIEMHGYLAYDSDIPTNRPAIIIAHAWRGQDDFARMKATALAKIGYVGFAADIYGSGKYATTDSQAAELMKPLFLNRYELQSRIKAAYDCVRHHPLVDSEKIGGIGFCFGGLTMIELFRSGVDLRGAVSFHAVLGNHLNGNSAQIVPISHNIRGSLLILHGHDDPLVTPSDITAIQNELTEAKVDWQMHIYGGTSHAFTNPELKNPASGLVYNSTADKRSWQSMVNFFNEIFA